MVLLLSRGKENSSAILLLEKDQRRLEATTFRCGEGLKEMGDGDDDGKDEVEVDKPLSWKMHSGER